MQEIKTEEIPEFNSFEEFCWWYVQGGYYVHFPKRWRMTDIGGTYETIIFRHNRYQVELYFISQKFPVLKHSHPGIHSCEVIHRPGGMEHDHAIPTSIEQIKNRISYSGTTHGGEGHPLNLEAKYGGYLLVIMEEWLPEAGNMTFISNRYVGWALSEQHTHNVKKFYPDALVCEKPFMRAGVDTEAVLATWIDYSGGKYTE